jgi:acetate kinase
VRILVVNCGSSTLKFRVVEVYGAGADAQEIVASGSVDRVGERSTLSIEMAGSPPLREEVDAPDHRTAAVAVLERIGDLDLGAAVHRIVHGGEGSDEAVMVDEKVAERIDALRELAPLHNGPALDALTACRERLGDVPTVAVFDTAFHSRMPEHASRYAIPHDLARRHGIRRFGFHGIAHRYLVERYATISAKALSDTRVVSLQLGNGCSAAAVDGGRSVDTSMGFTPLEGLVMGTRSGDLDPALVGWIARAEGVDVEEVEEWLNHRSGLLGLSGRSGDVRELMEAEAGGDEGARLALDVFCHRAKKYIGAYLAALGGADAVLFGGGIGENAPEVRARICTGLQPLGISVDDDANDRTIGYEERISSSDSQIDVYVIPVDEGVVMVRAAMALLGLH